MINKYTFTEFAHSIIEKNSGSITFADQDFSCSYKDFWLEAKNIAHHLIAEINVGDRVIIDEPNKHEALRFTFGVILAGGIAVLVDPNWNKRLKHKAITSTQARLILSENHEASEAPIACRNSAAITSTSASPNGKLPQLSATDPCLILFTSGTWDDPKGVTLTHKNLLTNASAIVALNYHHQEHTVLSCLPLFHVYQFTVGTLVPMLTGSDLVLLNKVDSFALKEALKKHQIYTLIAVPKLLEVFKKAINQKLPKPIKKLLPVFRKLPLTLRRKIFRKVHQTLGGNLTHFIVGGAPLDIKTDRFFQSLGFYTSIGYGLSETSPVITISHKQNRKNLEVGALLKNVAIKINEEDEIMVKGDNVFSGYWPDIKKDDWFNTGDLGEYKNQTLTLKGRKKDLIVYPSGEKITLSNIESLCSEVLDFEVGAVWYQKKLFLVYSNHETITNSMKAKAQNALPFFAYIHDVVVYPADKLPKTHTHKLNRKTLYEFIQRTEKASAED